MGQRDFSVFLYGLLGKRFFQRLELLAQLVRQLVAELLEVFADAAQFSRQLFASSVSSSLSVSIVTPLPSRSMSSGFGS